MHNKDKAEGWLEAAWRNLSLIWGPVEGARRNSCDMIRAGPQEVASDSSITEGSLK